MRDQGWRLPRRIDGAACLYRVVLDIELARDQHDAGAQEGEADSHQISIVVHPCHNPIERAEKAGTCNSVAEHGGVMCSSAITPLGRWQGVVALISRGIVDSAGLEGEPVAAG